MEEQIYVVDAEVSFSTEVPADLQESVRFALSVMPTPTDLTPTVRWADRRRALVGDFAVSAPSKAAAIEAAGTQIRERLGRSIPQDIRSVSCLSIKLGTL